MPKITHQHTTVFPLTEESVTSYVSDWHDGLKFALSFSHKETAESLKWTSHYQGILQLHSKVNPLIWYMYLSAYWEGDEHQIFTEKVMMVADCNYKHKH